jgi:hypothetical protein
MDCARSAKEKAAAKRAAATKGKTLDIEKPMRMPTPVYRVPNSKAEQRNRYSEPSVSGVVAAIGDISNFCHWRKAARFTSQENC